MLFARQRTAWSLLASTSRSRPQENAHSRPGQRFEKDSSKAPCLEAYRKQAAAQRTAAYYREPRGKKKKAALNQRLRDQEYPCHSDQSLNVIHSARNKLLPC